MSRLLPGKKIPGLKVKTIDGVVWDIKDKKPDNFIMIIFYRGYHCGICRKQLTEIDSKFEEFSKHGVDIIALSCDTESRARKTKDEWNIINLPLGYGLSIETAKKWGLYISRAVKDKEPGIFSEPGLFLVKPGMTLYSSIVATMPFARPLTKDVLRSIIGINKTGYPARGEVA